MSHRYLIGLMGPARSGKDTAANHLITTAGFERRAFADALKAMCRDVLQRVPPPSAVMENESGERSCVDWTCIARKSPFGRWFLQVVGTDIVRRIDGDFWVKALFDNYDYDVVGGRAQWVVIPDVRFPNEYAAIHNAGGVVWRVERTGWEEDAAVAAHASEQAWRHLTPDDVISAPSGNIAEVHVQTKAAWKRLQEKVTRDAYRT